MEFDELIKGLERLLDMGDKLDDAGGGAYGMSHGEFRTRDVCKNELGLFILYIADGCETFNEGQAALVNLLFGDRYGQVSAGNMKRLSGRFSAPNGKESLALEAFMAADKMLAQRNREGNLTAALVGMFEAFGALMAALSHNKTSTRRYEKYIQEMKTKAGIREGSEQKPKTSASKTAASAETTGDIDQYIPAGVTLTDNQRGYLAGVVGAMDMFGRRHVTTSQVGIFMKKDKSEVSSGIRPLMKKGILDINDDAEIVIAEKKPAAAAAKPAGTSAGRAKPAAAGAKAVQKKKAETIVRTRDAKFPDAGQYKGIHQVEDEPEPVSPLGTWAVPVPAGCSYTMDPDCAGSGLAGKYLLQIQSTEDCDFSRTYDSRFSFAIFASGIMLRSFSALIDLSTDEAGGEIMQTVCKADPRFEFFRRTAGLAIMTRTENAARNDYAVVFIIFTRGMQAGAMGQIVVHGKTRKQAKEEADRVLNSISAIVPAYGDEGVSPVVIGDRYALSYYEHNTLKLDNGIILPVPDGFKGSDDQALIGAPRVFSIVPKDYKDYSRAMGAAIGITAVPIQGDVPKYGPGICDQICGIITEQFEQQGIFISGVHRVVAQLTTGGIVFYQKQFDLDSYRYLGAKGILWTEKIGYIISFGINLTEKIADRNDVGNDAYLLISDWMNRIQLPGEKLYYIPSEDETDQAPDRIDNLISSPAPDLLHKLDDKPVKKAAPGAGTKPAAKKSAAKKPAAKTGGTKTAGTKKASSSAAKKPKIASATLDPQGGIMITGEHVRACEGATEMIVPEGVLSIGSEAFRGSSVEKIVLPKSLKKIDRGAFHNCKKLKEIEFPEGLEAIDAGVFEGCSALRDINLPDNVRNLDSTAFSDYGGGNMNLAIHLSARMAQRLWKRKTSQFNNPLYGSRFEIDGDYFKSLKEYMEYREKEIQAEAKFAQMDGRKAPVSELEPVEDDYFRLTDAGKGDIAENGVRYDMLRDKGPVIGDNSYVMKLGETAYLQVPEGVTEIQNGAFSGNKLEVVKLPGSLRILGQGVFWKNQNLRRVIFQEGLEKIGPIVFEECPNVSEIRLPDSVKQVDPEAFADEWLGDTSSITVYLSGNAARRIHQNMDGSDDEAFLAKAFVIDGNSYSTLSEYILHPKPPVQRSAAPAPASQGAAAPAGNDTGKQHQRNALENRISALEKERDSITGITGIFRRRRIQSEIDDLKDQLRRL